MTATEATVGEFILVAFFTNIGRKHPSFDDCVKTKMADLAVSAAVCLALRFLLARFDKTSLFVFCRYYSFFPFHAAKYHPPM